MMVVAAASRDGDTRPASEKNDYFEVEGVPTGEKVTGLRMVVLRLCLYRVGQKVSLLTSAITLYTASQFS